MQTQIQNQQYDSKVDILLSIARKLGLSSEETTRIVQDIKNINNTLSENSHQQYAIVKHIFDEAGEIRTTFNQSNDHAHQSVNELIETVSTIEQAFVKIEGSITLFDNIKKSTQAIYRVVQQTKILAMNAAVEAARVGEAGKGFSIVANEMQDLAVVCEEASKDIDSVVDSTQNQLNEVVNETKTHVIKGRSSTDSVDAALQELLFVFNGDKNNQADIKSPSVQSIVDSVGNMEQLAKTVMQMADNSKNATQNLNNEIEVSNQVLSDLIGVVTDKPIVNVKPPQAFQQLSEFRVIDVRRQDEFNDNLGHVSGAKLYPIQEDMFKDRLSRLNSGSAYLFICRSGGRSARAARIAQSLGFSNVFNLEGGMLAWDKCQLPVERQNS